LKKFRGYMGKLFVANYKMNGDKSFFRSVNILNKIKLKDTTLVLCPPFVYIRELKARRLALGAQDIYERLDVKPTGEISVKMLSDLGIKYAIIGHSDRRKMGETNAQIIDKVKLVIEYNITPIVCVGEEKFRSKVADIADQVRAIGNEVKGDIVFAYEPIWAIGTGKVPTISKINRAIALIKSIANEYNIECRVLYGGSVNKSNYLELLKSDADGFLVGGLSLKLNDFIEVLKGVDNG